MSAGVPTPPTIWQFWGLKRRDTGVLHGEGYGLVKQDFWDAQVSVQRKRPGNPTGTSVAW